MKRTFLPLFLALTLCLVVAACGRQAQPTTVPQPTLSSAATATAVPKAGTSATPVASPATTKPAGPTTAAQPAAPTTAAPAAATATRAAVAKPSPVNQATRTAAAALVNGEPVSLSEYKAQIALAESYFSKQPVAGQSAAEKEAALSQVRRQVLDWMIDQALIEQTATKMGIQVSNAQVDSEFNKAKGNDAAQFERWLKENSLTVDTFRAKLRSELLGAAVRDTVTGDIPAKMEQVHLRHILVASENEARQIMQQMRSSEDFVRLAKQYSLDLGTRDSGGDLGFYPRGVLSPEIDRVAFNIVVGQVSDVIHTAFGYHIIQVLERDPARDVPADMMTALRQEAFMKWLEAQRAQSQIEYLVD